MRLNSLRTIPFMAMLSYVLAAWVPAAGYAYKLTLNAGKHDRVNTPVCVLLEEQMQQANLNPVTLSKARSVTLTDAAGKRIPAQLTGPGLLNESIDRQGVVARELHFILPELKKGQLLRLTATLSKTPSKKEGFAWKDTPGEYSELSHAGRPVLRYMYKALDDSSKKSREQTYKVFHHMYDPAGTRLVTKGPGGLYSHHRGLFFGFNRCSYGDGRRADVWHCGGDAFQSHEGFLDEEAGPVLGRHLVTVHWHGQEKQVFAKERRQMTVYRVPGGHLVEFASCLASAGGKVKLDGDPQHAGFQFRAAQEVAAANQKLTYYLRPSGKGKMGGTQNWGAKAPNPECVNLPWNAMSFVVGGKRYTAVYLDKPTNPKEARYSERSYGRFGSYFEYELDEGKDLSVNYRLWLQDGEMTIPQAVALENDFTQPVEVTLK